MLTFIIPLLDFVHATPEYVPRRRRWNRTEAAWLYLQSMLESLGESIYNLVMLMEHRRIPRRRRIGGRLHTVHAFTTTVKRRPQQRSVKMDCDSKLIGIDNRCSACITDFQGPVLKVNRSIKGFGGQRVTDIYTGTIKWAWHDDEGRKHTFVIPNSYYVPSAGGRLLSPQHWAQTQSRSSADSQKYGEISYADKCILFWKGG